MGDQGMDQGMYVVIMAGGSGTRFWPMSRASHPKQFLKIIGDKPMIAATYERARALVPDNRVILVVGEEHRAETERLFAGLDVHILVEPQGRNTAPCIGLAASFVEHLGGNDPVVILPADHYIADPDVFCQAIREAAGLASKGGIVTLGIVPTRPETGYGYIERDKPYEGKQGVFFVRQFVEKPDFRTAVKYLSTDCYFWNAGIFVATPKTLLEEFSLHMPDFYEGLKQIRSAFGQSAFHSVLANLYERTEKISFDYAVMEKTSRPVYVIASNCGWSDVGSWQSLYEVRKGLEGNGGGNVEDGDALILDCRDCFVASRGKRLVAALGLRNILIVDVEDALLVADLERSQDVKEIIVRLKNSDHGELV